MIETHYFNNETRKTLRHVIFNKTNKNMTVIKFSAQNEIKYKKKDKHDLDNLYI